jgi:hypothetical protein
MITSDRRCFSSYSTRKPHTLYPGPEDDEHDMSYPSVSSKYFPGDFQGARHGQVSDVDEYPAFQICRHRPYSHAHGEKGQRYGARQRRWIEHCLPLGVPAHDLRNTFLNPPSAPGVQ